MLRTLAAAIAVFLTPALAASVPDDAGLLAADAEQKRIIVDQDLAAQRNFMHVNYILNGPSNRVLRKRDALANMAAGGVASESFERFVEGRQITGNVGIVMGREEVVPAAGSPLAKLHGHVKLHRRFTNVFLFEDGRWRFLARQATVVPSTPP